MYNRFSYYAVNSTVAQNTNAKSKLLERLYTDTDPDNRSEIITDITIRVPGKPGTMMMEIKVDPGAQPSCIPLHKFKILFSHLCRDDLPKEGLLDNTHNEFESYNGGDFTCYGHLTIDVKDKVTKKYHPTRFYMMDTEVSRILISHAASYWLGLVRVLCDNKAPQIKWSLVSETVPSLMVQLSRQAKKTRFGEDAGSSTVTIPARQPRCDTSTRNRRKFKLNVTDPDLLIPIKQTRVNERHSSDLREPQPSSSDCHPASSQPVSKTTTGESSVSLPSSPSGNSSTKSTSTSGTDSSSSETSSKSSSQPSSRSSSPEITTHQPVLHLILDASLL